MGRPVYLAYVGFCGICSENQLLQSVTEQRLSQYVSVNDLATLHTPSTMHGDTHKRFECQVRKHQALPVVSTAAPLASPLQ